MKKLTFFYFMLVSVCLSAEEYIISGQPLRTFLSPSHKSQTSSFVQNKINQGSGVMVMPNIIASTLKGQGGMWGSLQRDCTLKFNPASFTQTSIQFGYTFNLSPSPKKPSHSALLNISLDEWHNVLSPLIDLAAANFNLKP